MPYSFDQAGYLLSTIVFLVIALSVYQTMLMMFKVSDHNGKPGNEYYGLVGQYFG